MPTNKLFGPIVVTGASLCRPDSQPHVAPDISALVADASADTINLQGNSVQELVEFVCSPHHPRPDPDDDGMVLIL
jgi:hypothetical protein